MLLEFFERVIPAEDVGGDIVVAYGPKGPQKQIRLRTFAELMIFAEGAKHDTKNSYYFTPGRYHTDEPLEDNLKGLRKGKNCTGKNSFYLDVDLNHDSKPSYNIESQVIYAVTKLARDNDLPLPSYYIVTGGGLHIYWCFNSTLPPDQWREFAQKAKKRFIELDPKLMCDPTRAADLAGYMRIPESHNAKRGARVSDAAVMRKSNTTTAEFERFLDPSFTTAHSTTLSVLAGRSEDNKLPVRSAATGMTQTSDSGEPAVEDPIKLLKQCAPLGVLAVKPQNQDYEAWFGVARLMARAEDQEAGRAAYHLFSRQHSGYNDTDTNDKFDEAVESTTYSPTCSQMRAWAGLPPATCVNCPLFKKQGENGKPVLLQAEFMQPVPSVTPAGDDEVRHLRAVRNARAGLYVPMSVLGMQQPALAKRKNPNTFGLSVNGAGNMVVTLESAEKKGETYTMRVTHGVPWVQAKIRVQDEEGNYSFAVRMAHSRLKRDETWEVTTFVVSAEDFTSRSLMFRVLSMSGVPLHVSDPNSVAWKMIFAHIRSEYNVIAPEAALDKVEHAGWHNVQIDKRRFFVIGDRRYRDKGRIDLVEQSDAIKKHNASFEQRGTRAGAAELFRAMLNSCEPMGKFSMLAALAAPLMHMTPVAGGLVYLHGTSGRGKTLMLGYLQSLYGATDMRSAARGKDTGNSIMHQIGTRASMPFFIDETTTMSSKDLGDLMMTITDGRERARMEASSNSLREANEWSTIALATSNKGLADVEFSAVGEAQMARTISVNIDMLPLYTPNRDLPVPVVQATRDHCGQLGPWFVRVVLDHYEAVLERVCKWENRLRKSDTLLGAKESEDKFRVWRAVAAVCFTAAEIAGPGFGKVDGMNIMSEKDDVSSFTQTIAARLSRAAEVVDYAMRTGREAEDESEVTGGDNNTLIKEFVSDMAAEGSLSIYQIVKADGEALTTEEVIGKLSDTNLVHDPARAELVQLHIVEGKPYVDVVFQKRVLKRWGGRDPERAVDVSHLMNILRKGASIVKDPERGSAAKLKGNRDSVVTATGSVLPTIDTTTVRMGLLAPAPADLKLEWA